MGLIELEKDSQQNNQETTTAFQNSTLNSSPNVCCSPRPNQPV
jgi:hypothetical protein